MKYCTFFLLCVLVLSLVSCGSKRISKAEPKQSDWETLAAAPYSDKQAEAFKERLGFVTYPATFQGACNQLGIAKIGPLWMVGIGAVNRFVHGGPISPHYSIIFVRDTSEGWDFKQMPVIEIKITKCDIEGSKEKHTEFD